MNIISEFLHYYAAISDEIVSVKIIVIVSREASVANAEICHRHTSTIRQWPNKFHVPFAAMRLVAVIKLGAKIERFRLRINGATGATAEINFLGINYNIAGHGYRSLLRSKH